MRAASTHSTEYPLVSFSILTLVCTRTQVASTKRVLSGASFKWSKRRVLSSTRWLNFRQLVQLSVSVIANITFLDIIFKISVYECNKSRFLFHWIIKKKNGDSLMKIMFFTTNEMQEKNILSMKYFLKLVLYIILVMLWKNFI